MPVVCCFCLISSGLWFVGCLLAIGVFVRFKFCGVACVWVLVVYCRVVILLLFCWLLCLFCVWVGCDVVVVVWASVLVV